MLNPHHRTARWPPARKPLAALLAAFILTSLPPAARAQNEEESTGCKLKNHIYTCDGAVFQKALAGARSVGIETHNVDGVAQQQLKILIAKLGKSIAPDGSQPDLIFLIVPTAPGGVMTGPEQADLGTLRIYSATPDGARGHLLWAETVTSDENLPWPVVVRRLILQFESHFKIK
jgi:hypothetical protein